MNCMDPLGEIKNPFGKGRFPRIDMSADTDISDFFDYFFHRITSYNVCYTKLLREFRIMFQIISLRRKFFRIWLYLVLPAEPEAEKLQL